MCIRTRWYSALPALCSVVALTLALPEASAETSMTVRDWGASLPLVDEKIAVHVDHQVARTRLEHWFENPNGRRVEGVYQVSLGPHANVAGFSYWNGPSEIVGEMVESDVAKRIFVGVARTENRDPGLLRRMHDGLFKLNVFPILPAEKKKIVMHTEQWLPRQGDAVHLRIPVSLDTTKVTVDLRDPRPIGAITSPTHTLSVDTSSGHPVVTTRGHGMLDLQYEVSDRPWSLTTSHHKDAGQAAFVLLTAKADGGATSEPRDLTLVIDQSGSTAPWFGDVKAFAHAAIDDLGPSDRLNIVTYDNWARSLYREAQTATNAVRREAHAYVDGLTAYDYGSNFVAAWTQAQRSAHAGGNPDALLWISDGASFSLARAREKMGADADRLRVYTLAIGDAPDVRDFEALADHHGAPLGYLDSADIAGTVRDAMATVRAPQLEDVTLSASGGTVIGAPKVLPNLRSQGDYRVLAKVDARGPVTLELTGTLSGKTKTLTTSLDLSTPQHQPWLGRQWAQQRIDELAHKDTPRYASGWGWYYQPVSEPAAVAELTELGLTYNIVTRHTSFLAIPASELREWSRHELTEARQRKRDYLKQHPEAVGLSRNNMPPGDPVLHVEAPADAQHVTAYFPFDLVEDLHYSALHDDWRVRFLVPSNVPDGLYDVTIEVVDRDGNLSTTIVSYAIDSSVEPFDFEQAEVEGAIRVRIRSEERLFEARLVTAAGVVPMRSNADRQLWQAELPLGTRIERIVLADEAGNEKVVNDPEATP